MYISFFYGLQQGQQPSFISAAAAAASGWHSGLVAKIGKGLANPVDSYLFLIIGIDLEDTDGRTDVGRARFS